ncbi:MAG: hypothetical protein JST92_20530, partial [Deltaproteobacteria bacterium]|nr:hypothetical protein [Deltaproteobacteria bacterium]
MTDRAPCSVIVGMSHWITRGAIALVFLGAFCACAPGPAADGIEPFSGCIFDRDCPTPFYCVDGACQVDPDGCEFNSDCIDHHTCVGGACLLDCPAPGCPAGQTCDDSNGVCVPADPVDDA